VADNVVLNPGSGGDTVAADDIGGVKHQRVKIEFGADGSATDVSTTNPLPVGDAGGTLSVDDGGGSLTVDGTVSIAGSVSADTELPAASALADNITNPTTPVVGAAMLGFDGTNWDRLRVGLGDGAGATGIANVLPMVFNGTTHDRVPGNATDGILVNLGANNDVVVSGTVTANIASAPTGASAIQHQGTAAHDVAVVGNPVTIGMRASADEPTAVSTDGDVVWAWSDRFGRQVVLPGHPNPEPPATINATASGDTTVIAAPGAGVSIYVCKASVHNRDATNRVVALRDGTGGTIRWRAEIANEGGGSLIDFGARGWKLTANTALVVNLDAAGSVDVNITEYYLAP
jgi:hypothetical protein